MGGRLKITLVLFALVAAIGAGCGGDDDDTNSGGAGSASNGSAAESGSGSAPTGSGREAGDSQRPSGDPQRPSGNSKSPSDDAKSPSSGSGSASGDSAGGSGATPSKTEFLAQGNEICLETRNEIGEEIKALLQEQEDPGAGGLDTAEEIAAEIVLPHFKTQNEELRELSVPAGDEAEVEAFLDTLEGEVEEAEADTSVLLGANVSPFLPARKLAIKAGLTKCGRI